MASSRWAWKSSDHGLAHVLAALMCLGLRAGEIAIVFDHGVCYRIDRACELWLDPVQVVEQHIGAHHEHAGVPAVFAGVQVGLRGGGVRLLHEAFHEHGVRGVGNAAASDSPSWM